MRQTLGRTGFQVFPLGLGGHTYSIGEGSQCFATPDDRARLVKRLVDGGVNYFDTTWMNEVQVLADSFRRAGVGRDAVVSLQYVDAISDGKWREKLRREVESRLEVMGYDRAPLFIMGVGNNQPGLSEVIAALEAMARLREEGLIARMGVSCHELGHFKTIAQAIERTDLIDYMMIRFNWKFQQASEDLFGLVKAKNIGLVIMKVFCWDCGPGQWGHRISVFEPAGARETGEGLTAAQRALIWVLQNSPAATTVPSINAMWEAEECLEAMRFLSDAADTTGFSSFADRLWRKDDLLALAEKAESRDIRDRARALAPGGR